MKMNRIPLYSKVRVEASPKTQASDLAGRQGHIVRFLVDSALVQLIPDYPGDYMEHPGSIVEISLEHLTVV